MLWKLPEDVIEKVLDFCRLRDVITVLCVDNGLKHACGEVRTNLLVEDKKCYIENSLEASSEWTKRLSSIGKHFGNLSSVSFRRCNIDDESLTSFLSTKSCSHVQEVHLVECRSLTNKTNLLEQISPCRSLAFSKCSAMKKFIIPSLRKNMNNSVECLVLDGTIQDTDDCCVTSCLENGFSALRTLVLSNCTILDWDFLNSLTNLEHLFLGGSKVVWNDLYDAVIRKSGKPIKTLEVTFHDHEEHADGALQHYGIQVLDFTSTDTITFSSKEHGNFYQSAVSVAVNCRNRWNETPLHTAVRENSLEKVKKCVQIGCHIDAINIKCNTPLMVASDLGYENIVKYLLDCGADQLTRNQIREYPFFVACLKGHFEIVKYMLSKVDDPHSFYNKPELYPKDWTPVMAACVGKHLEILDILLEKGLKNNHQNSRLLTPLHVACHRGFAEGVQLLLNMYSDADMNMHEEFGRTALDFALERNNRVIIGFLDGLGATCRNPSRKSGKAPGKSRKPQKKSKGGTKQKARRRKSRRVYRKRNVE